MDLNSDLGEGFGQWRLGDDEALLDVVTSANVACGFHASDPSIMYRVCAWAAAITSVIGASYTTISFVTSRTRTRDRTRTLLVVGFIAVTTLAFLLIGAAPTTLLVFAGAFNGLLLPIGIAVILWVATRRSDLLNGYRYPHWLLVVGWAAWLLTLYLAVNSIRPVIALFS